MTEPGITADDNAMYFSMHSSWLIEHVIVIGSNSEQKQKTQSPISVIEFGIVIDGNSLCDAKAFVSIALTKCGIS
mgnify:CR=1 FL=1